MSTRAPLHAVGLLFLGALLVLWAQTAAAATSVIYSFTGEEEGEYPATELVIDDAGNLYGTTTQGGDFNAGTVFRLAPDGSGGWTKSVLHSFNGFSDGLNPYGGVAIDPQGNLYGTTTAGGVAGICAEDGCGVVFKLTRQGSSYSFGVIHDFTGGNDGWGAGGQPALDAAGNVYGTTPNGGRHAIGVVYRLSPDGGGGYAFRVIHAFTGGNDGGTGSLGRLLVDGAGKTVFGIATVGGEHGAGVVYRLRQLPNGLWRQRTLYAFQGAPDAGFPYGGLSADRAGNLYGTTYYDGANGYGTVYQLSRNGSQWTERVLHSFNGGTDGNNPSTNLVFDAQGNIYGTTAEGGSPGCNCGTIFKLSPDGGNWTESIVYRFRGVPDGAYSYYSLVADGAGHYYGATVHGGEDNDGAIYEFTP